MGTAESPWIVEATLIPLSLWPTNQILN